MGVFDTISAELRCPVSLELKVREIQVKWVEDSMRRYDVGDVVKDYDEAGFARDIWKREEYACDDCSVKETVVINGKQLPGLVTYKKIVFHDAYIHLQNARITEVLSEQEYVRNKRKEK